jgi:hypothetical protein
MPGVIVKVVLLYPVPPIVVTPITLVTAPVGTVAVICESVLTVKDDAATPPNVTAVAPVKYWPETITLAPTAPLDGLKPLIVGIGTGDPAVVTVTLVLSITPA